MRAALRIHRIDDDFVRVVDRDGLGEMEGLWSGQFLYAGSRSPDRSVMKNSAPYDCRGVIDCVRYEGNWDDTILRPGTAAEGMRSS